jgi:site-specific DNA recombinase
MTKRAGVYGRESKGEAKSIADQLEIGEDAVSSLGWVLAGRYQDDSSASARRRRERKDWDRLRADTEAGRLDVIVIWKMARGSRDIDWFPLLETCAERGVLIHLLADRRTYDPRQDGDWKYLASAAVDGIGYVKGLGADVQRGVDMAAAKGLPHGRAPFGYGRSYDENRKALRMPNEHADTVREIFRRLDAHTPIITLTEDLRARRVPSPSGTGWHRKTIRTIATNRSYVGIRRHAGQDHPAQWPAIVDESMFWRVQALLGDPERKTTKQGQVKWLLSHLVKTPCGSVLNRKTPRRPNSPDSLACGRDGCVSVGRQDLDEVVTRVILGRLALPNARKLFLADDKQIEAAKGELARYEQQIEEARASFELPDGISAEALARKERALAPLIEDARRRSRPEGVGGALAALIDAENPRRAWDALEVAGRRSVIRHLAELTFGRPVNRVSRYSTPEERAEEAFARLAGSRWAGDELTWQEHLDAESAS